MRGLCWIAVNKPNFALGLSQAGELNLGNLGAAPFTFKGGV